jgi:hypothetical protein
VTYAFRLRQLVHFCSHYSAGIRPTHQPLPRVQIRREARMPRIHEEQHGSLPRAIEKSVCDLTELRLAFTWAGVPRVSISRQIHQVTGLHRSASHAIDVGQSRLARSAAGSRQLLTNECVDQARLADVRSPDHRHFRQLIAREIASTGGARDELRDYLHARWLSAPGVRLSCRSDRASAPDEARRVHGMIQSPELVNQSRFLSADACLLRALSHR